MNVDSMTDHAGSMEPIYDVINQLKIHEGFREKPYTDTTGHLTIGYGINLAAGITEREASIMLEGRVRKLQLQLSHVIKFWDELSWSRQDVLTNMAYNLGISGLLKFKKMLLATNNRDYDRAAYEMLHSLWAEQVGHRAEELAAQMMSG